LFKICLINWNLLWFPRNLRVNFSVSLKNVIWILIGIILNLWIIWGTTDIWPVILLIHKHRTFNYLFKFSSFINVLWFSVYRSFTSLVKFPQSISFVTIVNGIFKKFAVQTICYQYIETLVIFLCWFCNLQLYWIYLSVLTFFGGV
jgi:hypothetical protein